MNEHDATEQAFRNGYNAGVRELAERLKAEKFIHKNFGELVQVEDIDPIANELIVNYESSKNDKQRKEDRGNEKDT